MNTVYELTKMQKEILSALIVMAEGEGDEFRYTKNALSDMLGVRSWGHYRNDVMRRLVNMGVVDQEITKTRGRYTYYWGISPLGRAVMKSYIATATKRERSYKTYAVIDMSGAR
jgi:predicted transcriptional regulator